MMDPSDFAGKTAQASSRKDAGGGIKTQELKRREPQPRNEILGWVQGLTPSLCSCIYFTAMGLARPCLPEEMGTVL